MNKNEWEKNKNEAGNLGNLYYKTFLVHIISIFGERQEDILSIK